MIGHNCNITRCDAMVRRYLPAMRAEMVHRLVESGTISQSDAARRLGITRAAVSQYMSRKRGEGGIEISTEMSLLIDRWAMAVLNGEAEIVLCDLCRCAMKAS
jgi:predicted transcriptional regulator